MQLQQNHSSANICGTKQQLTVLVEATKRKKTPDQAQVK
jgi:hypothetical protein